MAEVTITWTVAILILGVLAILITQAMSKKAGTRKAWLWIGGIASVLMVVVLLVGSANLPASLGFLSSPIMGGTTTVGDLTLTTVPGGQSASPVIDGKCVGIEDTTVTLSAVDKYTSIATGGTHRYRVNNAPALTVSNAGSFTASPGDKIQVLWENASLSSTYYGAVDEFVVPCSGTVTYAEQLVKNGTITIEVFNEEGNLIDGTPENETLTTGDVVTLTAKIKGTYQRGIAYGGVIVAEWNNTIIDDVIVDLGGSKVSTPQVHSSTYGADSSIKTYSIPSILSNQILDGSIVIDVDDSVDPSGQYSVNDIILTFYPNNYFINEDSGGAYEGPATEDEDNVQTFSHKNAYTLHVD